MCGNRIPRYSSSPCDLFHGPVSLFLPVCVCVCVWQRGLSDFFLSLGSDFFLRPFGQAVAINRIGHGRA